MRAIIFVVGLVALLSQIGCQRHVFEYANFSEPKDRPAYSAEIDQNKPVNYKPPVGGI